MSIDDMMNERRKRSVLTPKASLSGYTELQEKSAPEPFDIYAQGMTLQERANKRTPEKKYVNKTSKEILKHRKKYENLHENLYENHPWQHGGTRKRNKRVMMPLSLFLPFFIKST